MERTFAHGAPQSLPCSCSYSAWPAAGQRPASVTCRKALLRRDGRVTPAAHRRVCNAVNTPDDASSSGNPAVQDDLVQMLRLQVGREKVKELVDLESGKLRMSAEAVKEEADRLRQLAKDSSDKAFEQALDEINQEADDFEAKLAASREEAQRERAAAAAWEYQNALDRSAGHFFRSLYEPDKELLKQMGAAALETMSQEEQQRRLAELRAQAQRSVRSPVRVYLFACLSVVLIAYALFDAYSARPSAPQDVFYVALGITLGVTAWYEKRVL